MLNHGDFQHLTSFEWEALRRLADVAGITTVVAKLKDMPERLQRVVITKTFVNRELADLRRRASTPAVDTGSDVFNLVSCYSGEGMKRLALMW
ncbi:unnamed protein product [Peronospora belbahrii]|uniref:Uncharacterized protein n=1 Tax=Peronospora belbahrii TaxID=622444 RepID=A0AAU9KLD9_9STRA|nr:unnamed protein product [Peronospora belbahrii]